MGAALTYARRYALFTLVGIAGEDDMDAPELAAPASEPSQDLGVGRRRANGDVQAVQPSEMPARRRKPSVTNADSPLDEEQSAQLRDQLIAELERIGSGDEAAIWAQRTLGTKITLMPADASAVEGAFAQKLSSLEQSQIDPGIARDDDRPDRSEPVEPGATEAPLLVSDSDSRPVLQKGIRLRDKEHRKFVASKPCLVCGRMPSDPHHLRFAQPRALGRRVSDEFTVPLCRLHHRELHRKGDEAAWWQENKIDLIAAFEQNMGRDENAVLEDANLVGKDVHLEDASPTRFLKSPPRSNASRAEKSQRGRQPGALATRRGSWLIPSSRRGFLGFPRYSVLGRIIKTAFR